MSARFVVELWPELGYAAGQAARWSVTAMPSVNLTPAMTIGKRFSPFSRRQVLDAAMTSLKTMRRAVLCERAPWCAPSGA